MIFKWENTNKNINESVDGDGLGRLQRIFKKNNYHCDII